MTVSLYLSTHGSESAGRALGEWHRTLGEWHRALCLCPRALSLCDRARSNALVRAVTDALSTMERLACDEHEVVDREELGRGGDSRGPVELRIHLEADTAAARSQSGARLHVGGEKREKERVQTCQRRHRLCQCPASLLHSAEGATMTMREVPQRTPLPRRPRPSIVLASRDARTNGHGPARRP